ncbi:Coronin-like protein [Venturia inaequalis]|nr:Coronin-like protein [Venturia inaequalis]
MYTTIHTTIPITIYSTVFITIMKFTTILFLCLTVNGVAAVEPY